MSVIGTCPCGQKNRLLPGTRQCCGKCKREFTPAEVLNAALGIPIPTKPVAVEGAEEEDYEDGGDDE